MDVNGYLYSQDDIRITSMISEEITCYVVDYREVIVIGDVIEMLKRLRRVLRFYTSIPSINF